MSRRNLKMNNKYMVAHIYHYIIFFELAIVFNRVLALSYQVTPYIWLKKFWVRYLYISKGFTSKDTIRCEVMHIFQFSYIYKGVVYLAA